MGTLVKELVWCVYCGHMPSRTLAEAIMPNREWGNLGEWCKTSQSGSCIRSDDSQEDLLWHLSKSEVLFHSGALSLTPSVPVANET